MLSNFHFWKSVKRTRKAIANIKTSSRLMAITIAIIVSGDFILSLFFSWSGLLPMLASIGGMIVFLGLWIEKEAEIEERSIKRSTTPKKLAVIKFKSEIGWIVLMLGIVAEILIGAGIAAFDWYEYVNSAREIAKNNPLNQPIAEVSAVASIVVKGGNLHDELDFQKHFGGISMSAWMYLCDSNRPATNSWPLLSSDKFSRMFFDDKTSFNGMDRTYGIRFQQEIFASSSTNRAMEINDIFMVSMNVCFLPTNSEILRGNVVVTVNSSLQKVFQIPPQIKPVPATQNAFDLGITIIATNAGPAYVIASPKK